MPCVRLQNALLGFLDGRLGPDDVVSVLEEIFREGELREHPELSFHLRSLDMELCLFKPHLEARFKGWRGKLRRLWYELSSVEPAPSARRIRNRINRVLELIEKHGV